MNNLVEVDEERQVGVTRRLRQQDSCLAKRCKVSESVSEAADLAVELMDGASGLMPLGVQSVADPRIEKLSGRFEIAMVTVVSSVAKVSLLTDLCRKLQQ